MGKTWHGGQPMRIASWLVEIVHLVRILQLQFIEVHEKFGLERSDGFAAEGLNPAPEGEKPFEIAEAA